MIVSYQAIFISCYHDSFIARYHLHHFRRCTVTTYAVVNTKGGVGKTTVSVHLATMLAKRGTTRRIHGDPQATAASSAAWRRETSNLTPSPTTTCLTGKAVFNEGKALAGGFEHVVVDAGGRDTAGLRAALLLAQRAIIPVGASNLGAAAMTDLLTEDELARDYNPDLDVRVLLNLVEPRTNNTAEMLEGLAEERLRV